MRHTATLHMAVLCALILCPALTAQQRKVVPPGFAQIEGDSRNTYPFGRATAGLQVIVDADWITANAGVVQGVRFRAEGDLTTAFAGYGKAYDLTVATTPVTAANMGTDPTLNHGGVTPTLAFNSVLNLPTSGPLTQVPAPFAVHLPFAAPHPYDGQQGSLILTLTTPDAIAPPGRWNLDAVTIRTAQISGHVRQLAAGCTNPNGQGLTMTADPAQLTVAGNLSVTVQSSQVGAFPVAVVLLGLTRIDFDLTPLGMAGCRLTVANSVGTALIEGGASYPPYSVPIPNNPILEGGALFVATLGWAQPQVSMAGSVTSDTLGLRIGNATFPTVKGQSIFSTNLSSWFIGAVGTYMPVLELDGVFP